MRTVMKVIVSLILAQFAVSLNAQTAASEYKIANRFPVEGNGFWDALTVDSAGGRVFLSHGTVVQVLDEKTGKLIGTITGTEGVHGIALAPDFNKGFTSDGRSNTVTVFNLKTLGIITKIPVAGVNPDAIIYDPFSHLVFAFNGRTSNASVIDAKNDKVTAAIPLSGKPEFAESDNAGLVYVNIEDQNSVSVIDTKTLKVVNTWPLNPGEEPSGIAIDNATRRLFISCNNLMVIMDALNGKIITNLPIGGHVDGTAFDPVLKRAYAPSGNGLLTVVQEVSQDIFKVLENTVTQKGARTIAIDTATHHLFLPAAEFGPAPQPSAENPRPRPVIKPGSFIVLDVAPVK